MIEHSRDMGFWFRLFKPSKQNQIAPQNYEESVRPVVELVGTTRYALEHVSGIQTSGLDVAIVGLNLLPPSNHYTLLLYAKLIATGGATPAGTTGFFQITSAIPGTPHTITIPSPVDVDVPHSLVRPLIIPRSTQLQGVLNQATGVGVTLLLTAAVIHVPLGERILF